MPSASQTGRSKSSVAIGLACPAGTAWVARPAPMVRALRARPIRADGAGSRKTRGRARPVSILRMRERRHPPTHGLPARKDGQAAGHRDRFTHSGSHGRGQHAGRVRHPALVFHIRELISERGHTDGGELSREGVERSVPHPRTRPVRENQHVARVLRLHQQRRYIAHGVDRDLARLSLRHRLQPLTRRARPSSTTQHELARLVDCISTRHVTPRLRRVGGGVRRPNPPRDSCGSQWPIRLRPAPCWAAATRASCCAASGGDLDPQPAAVTQSIKSRGAS